MPRYYFDIQDDRHCHDVDGIELSDQPAAEQEALRVLLSLATDIIREKVDREITSPLSVTMRNGGTPLFKATISIAIDRK